MIKINNNIPGWNRPDALEAVGKLAAEVRDGGFILELGGFFGRTTYSLGHNKLPSVKLLTIDHWITYHFDDFENDIHDGNIGEEELKLYNSKISKNPDRITGVDFYDLFKAYTAGIPNAESIISDTKLSHEHIPMIDFIYHDADHSYDGVYTDLVHWFPKLKDDGIIVIDDYYESQFPDLCRAVDQFSKENNLTKIMITDRNILLKR